MRTICKVTPNGYFEASAVIQPREGIPPGWVEMPAPTGPGPFFERKGNTWISRGAKPDEPRGKIIVPVSFWLLRLTMDEMKAFKRLDIQQKALTDEDYDDPAKAMIVNWAVFMEHFNRLTTEIDLGDPMVREGVYLFCVLANLPANRLDELLAPPAE